MISSFPHRLIAAVFQSAVVLFEHLPPVVAAAVFLAAVVTVVAVSVAVPWQTARLVVRAGRWVRYRAADRRALAELNREYAGLCESHPADLPATPPPVRSALKRRRMSGLHITRRRMRRNTTTSTSSDRSSR